MSDCILDFVGNKDEDLAKTERIYGVVPAEVTNIQDEEKLGRIKVKFPWLADQSETDWIRVMSFWAGNSRGGFFLPEVGDEVLVAFEHGNLNTPYVIGQLYNSKDIPPENNEDGNNDIKILKSRCGHTVTLDDNDQEAKIEIKTNAGHTITMNDKSGSETVEIKDKSGSNKITIETSSNKISIESGMDINIKSTNVTVEASGNLNLKGAMVKVEASGNMDLNATGIATLKGSMANIN